MIDFKDSTLQKNFIKHLISAYNEYNNKENISELTTFNSLLKDFKKIIDSGHENFIYDSLQNFSPDRDDLKVFISNILDSISTYDFSYINNQLISYKLFFIPISFFLKGGVKYFEEFSNLLFIDEIFKKNYLINENSSIKLFPRTLGVSEIPLGVESRRKFFKGMIQLNKDLLPNFENKEIKKDKKASAFSSFIVLLITEKADENKDSSIFFEGNFTSIDSIKSSLDKASLDKLNLSLKSILNEMIISYKEKVFTGISYPFSSWDNSINQCLLLHNSLQLKLITDKIKKNYAEFPESIYIDIEDKTSENYDQFFNIKSFIHSKDLFELNWFYHDIDNKKESLRTLIKNLINHKYETKNIKISYINDDDFGKSTSIDVDKFVSGNF